MDFFQVLTLIFVTLKLTNTIDWSWFWVLSPMLPMIVIFGLWLGALILGVCLGGKVRITKIKKEK